MGNRDLYLYTVDKQQNIASIFPKHLFWDVDMNKLDLQKDKGLIIPRALFATTESTFSRDITRLESLYSQEEILTVLKTTKELISNNVCKWVADRYAVNGFERFKL